MRHYNLHVFQLVSLSPSDRGSCSDCHYPHDERLGDELEAEGHELPAYPAPGTQSDLLDIARAVNEHSLQFVAEAKRLASQCLDRRLRVVRCSAAFSAALSFCAGHCIVSYALSDLTTRDAQALLQLAERITTLATQLKIVSTVKAALIGASGILTFRISSLSYSRVVSLHKEPLLNLFASEPVVEPGGSIIQPGNSSLSAIAYLHLLPSLNSLSKFCLNHICLNPRI